MSKPELLADMPPRVASAYGVSSYEVLAYARSEAFKHEITEVLPEDNLKPWSRDDWLALWEILRIHGISLRTYFLDAAKDAAQEWFNENTPEEYLKPGAPRTWMIWVVTQWLYKHLLFLLQYAYKNGKTALEETILRMFPQ